MHTQFKKMNQAEIGQMLARGIFQRCQLSLSHQNKQKVVKVKLVSIPEEVHKRVYVLPLTVEELKDKMCAFSYKIGTQMYFFKAKMRFNNKGFYVDASQNIFELIRRKQIRFEAHKSCPIECSIVLSEDEKFKLKTELINISSTGASIKVDASVENFKKNQQIYLYLKQDKKAGVSLLANIRFAKKKAAYTTEIGVEFIDLDGLQKSKINKMCEDLSRFIFTG